MTTTDDPESLLNFKDLCCISSIFLSCWKLLIYLQSLHGSHSISPVIQMIFSVLFLLLVFSGMIKCQKITIQNVFKHSWLYSRCSSVTSRRIVCKISTSIKLINQNQAAEKLTHQCKPKIFLYCTVSSWQVLCHTSNLESRQMPSVTEKPFAHLSPPELLVYCAVLQCLLLVANVDTFYRYDSGKLFKLLMKLSVWVSQYKNLSIHAFLLVFTLLWVSSRIHWNHKLHLNKFPLHISAL